MELSNLALENFVTVTHNNSLVFSAEDIVSICKRKNNPKRDFLFVNRLQGKHLHVNPIKTFKLYDELVSVISNAVNPNEKIIVIGFAETATAIGHYIASSLVNCIYYMQTTRESIPNATSLLEFQEEHSHATEQFLYGDIEELQNCDRIIFVDDEISTGNTVLNFIREVERLGIHMKYGVASLLNWQDDNWSRKFKELNIDTYFVLKGKLKNLFAKVPVSISSENLECPELTSVPEIIEVKCPISNFFRERVGEKPCGISQFAETIYSSISSVLGCNMPNQSETVLVLGTEEYMFAPMVFAKKLSETLVIDVQFHATTRSPIETSGEFDYTIKHRYPITSCYDSARNTNIYNLEKYDKVYIITDVIPNSRFVNDISSALALVGCNVKNVIILTMKG